MSRARDQNLPIGDSVTESVDVIGASSLSLLSVRFRRAILPNQLRVSQPFTSDRRTHLPKPLSIIVFAFIETEGLLVQVPAQMSRINTDVSTLEGTFQEAPEILDVVRVYLSPNKLNRMVNHFMRVDIGKAQIRFESVGVEMRSGLDGGAYFRGQCSAAHIGNVHGLDPARPLVASALDDPENCFFAGAARAFDLPLADVTGMFLASPPMKVSSASTSPLNLKNVPVCIASRIL